MSVTLTVHRGTHQIGGSCIEIRSSNGSRLVMDAGRPLDAPSDAAYLLPKTLDISSQATVLISHSHQDHWGLVDELPRDWTVLASKGTAELINVTAQLVLRSRNFNIAAWPTGGSFAIGPFVVHPILTDHSAFDAHMLLVEVEGKRILYSGDFRTHGRKGELVRRLFCQPPRDVDVLLMEGTNLGSGKPVKSEQSLEDEFARLFADTRGNAFVSWSAQNIDRTVTLYRAAKRTGRRLAIDLYAADILDRISQGTAIPRPGWPNLEVVVTSRLARAYRKLGRDDFVNRMVHANGDSVKTAVSARALRHGRRVIMLRRSMIPDFEQCGVMASSADSFAFSMWRGYSTHPDLSAPMKWCRDAGARIDYIHTSGHASESALASLVSAVNPKTVIPIHGDRWDDYRDHMGPIVRLSDGQEHVLH